jgi:hypothetical protein
MLVMITVFRGYLNILSNCNVVVSTNRLKV